jgi:hypothetical protein
MNAKQAIQAAMDMSSMVVTRYLSDLSDADLLRRPGKGCNHLAWQLGHVLSSSAGLINAVAPGKGPQLPEGFDAKHAKDRANVDDPKQFYSKQEYLELMEKANKCAVEALSTMSEADLDKPAPERVRSFCPTVGNVFILIAQHPLMHAGQFVPVRRELGKPVAI